MEKDGINSFGAYLELITNRNPVVHQITNFVTANDCANAVLAMGGRTVMADYIEEIEEIQKGLALAKAKVRLSGGSSVRVQMHFLYKYPFGWRPQGWEKL